MTGSTRGRIVLAVESSCDETAAAVVVGAGDGAWVRSSVIASQVPIHARYGGVVPELASRSHLTAVRPVVEQALADAGVTLQGIDAVAVTAGPGLAGCLLVGLQAAKALAWARDLPIVPVDHIEAHVHAVFLRDEGGAGEDPPEHPYIALAVSGGHTSVYRVEAPGRSVVLGQTIDDAAGEAFDKVAKMMGLPYPGGAVIDRMARRGRAEAVELPRPMLGRGLDFSFSGLKTAARYWMERHPEAVQGESEAACDLAAGFQEAVVDVLVDKALAACRAEGVPRIVVAGGVACNSRLRERMVAEAGRVGVRAWIAPARYCTDNAAMVGGLAAALLERGAGVRGEARARLDIYTTRRPST